MKNEPDFAERAETAIATRGVFVATFDELAWLWNGQNVKPQEKAERIIDFAVAHGWRAVPGTGDTEVVFERRTLHTPPTVAAQLPHSR